MYLAQTLDSSSVQSTLYVDILENILANNNHTGKVLLDDAIVEARAIAMEEKDVYSIDKKHFFFVTTLLKKYYTGLVKLSDKEITQDTYTDILGVLK